MLKLYAEQECVTPIKNILWDNKVVLQLVSGKELPLPQTVRSGEVGTATIWIRNESNFRYAVTKIALKDSRIKYAIDEDVISPNKPVKLVLSFNVPKTPTINDVVFKDMLTIDGYYIIS